MANNKKGFNYYTIDTDRYQDRRIKRLKKDHGCDGFAVYDYILCEIYRVEGCFIVWDENTVFDVADYFRLKESSVNEIITYCGVVGLFDKELLTREKIITSKSIQSRYVNMSKLAKRSNIHIPENIRILPEESPIIPEESPKTPEEFHIVKYSKVKDSKISISSDLGDAEREKILKVFFFKHCLINPTAEAERFINHYEATGWVTAKGIPIQDRLAVARNWKCQDNLSRHDANFMTKWQVWYEKISTLPEAGFMITDLFGAVETDGKAVLTVSEQLHRVLESNIHFAKPLFSMISYKIKTPIP